MNVIEFISQPWHWAISGALIAFTMFLLLFFGKRFGVSSSFQAACAFTGVGKKVSYFNINLKDYTWLFLFVVGSIIGGFFVSHYLASPLPVNVSDATVTSLENLGITVPTSNHEGAGFIPEELFNFKKLASLPGLIVMVLGGFLVGFGARWAGGCTSGHAISGLSNLQLPSLIAVIGFFIGGLLTTFLLLPIILN